MTKHKSSFFATPLFALLFLAAAVGFAAPPDNAPMSRGPKKDVRESRMEKMPVAPPDEAHMDRGSKGNDREPRMEEIHKELNLTPEQDNKLKEHREAHRAQNKKLRDEMKEKRQALAAELEKENLDMNQINKLQAELKAIHNQMADQRLEGVLEVRKILTAEQFEKFNELTQQKERQWKKGGKEKKGHHGDMH